MQFPVFQTKEEGKNEVFDLNKPEEVKKYFEYKAGPEIEKIKKYLENNTFVAYLLGKKSAGKGVTSKMFTTIFGTDKVGHISVGDVVREVDEEMADPKKKEGLIEYLKKNYRGYYSLEEILKSQEDRGTGKPLLPTEYILTLLKREIEKMGKKTLFIDGLPRTLDQVSYSLFFRELIGYREDPDMFILLQVPEIIIDERIKTRVICPKCHTPRNLKLHMTAKAGFDEKENKFYLNCDNPQCNGERMVTKEGDEQGIEPIRERLTNDGKLIEMAFSLYGVPKVLLRNSVPVSEKDKVDEYELTPEFVLNYDKESKKVVVTKKAYVIKDDEGIDSYSLLPQAVAVSMIKQIADNLEL
jgi:adenylate kinase family enzyme